MSLNATKTEFMIIASNYKLLNLANTRLIHIDNNPLQRVEYSKSLGVFIDEKLAWTKHIDHMSKKFHPLSEGLDVYVLLFPWIS